MVKLLTSVSLLLFSQVLLLTGHRLQLTLLPLRAQLEGFSLAQIGLTGTAYFAGFALGCVAVSEFAPVALDLDPRAHAEDGAPEQAPPAEPPGFSHNSMEPRSAESSSRASSGGV